MQSLPFNVFLSQLMRDESKRPYMTFSARRKRANASVKVIGQGTGSISINGNDIHYFQRKQDKEQVNTYPTFMSLNHSLHVMFLFLVDHFPFTIQRHVRQG